MSDEPKHTPAPWSTSIACWVWCSPDQDHAKPRYEPHFGEIYPSAELEANARLMAAAPDLLRACESALPLLQHLNRFLKYQRPGREFYPAREDGDAAIDELSASIAKAKGGQS